MNVHFVWWGFLPARNPSTGKPGFSRGGPSHCRVQRVSDVLSECAGENQQGKLLFVRRFYVIDAPRLKTAWHLFHSAFISTLSARADRIADQAISPIPFIIFSFRILPGDCRLRDGNGSPSKNKELAGHAAWLKRSSSF